MRFPSRRQAAIDQSKVSAAVRAWQMNRAIPAQTDRGAVYRGHLFRGAIVYSAKSDVPKATRETTVSLGDGRLLEMLSICRKNARKRTGMRKTRTSSHSMNSSIASTSGSRISLISSPSARPNWAVWWKALPEPLHGFHPLRCIHGARQAVIMWTRSVWLSRPSGNQPGTQSMRAVASAMQTLPEIFTEILRGIGKRLRFADAHLGNEG